MAFIGFLFAGTSSGHLDSGDPVHIDIESSDYVAGEPVTFHLFVSNPRDEPASFMFPSSCDLFGSVESERRLLASWDPHSSYCLMYVWGLDVPARTSQPWHTVAFETNPDDGCIRFHAYLYGYDVSGQVETCPGPSTPSAPPTRPMVLVVSAPSAAESGGPLALSAMTRTPEGTPIEGIRINVSLGDESSVTALTGPDGTAYLATQVPVAIETTMTSLLVHAVGEGWRSATETRNVTVSPPDVPRLILRSALLSGDIVHSEGTAVLEYSVRGSDGTIPEALSVDIQPTLTFVIEQETDLGDGRHVVVLRAKRVSESQVASVRIATNAPGFAGAESLAEYHVLAVSPAVPEGSENRRDHGAWIVPLSAAVIVACAGVWLCGLWRRQKARQE